MLNTYKEVLFVIVPDTTTVWPDGRGIWHNDEKNFLVSIQHDAIITFLWDYWNELKPFILPQNECMCILMEFKKGKVSWSFDMGKEW